MSKLLYIDAEWVPISPTYEKLQEEFPLHAEAWSRKCIKSREQARFANLTDSEIYDIDAGFYPEFIKIICISAGYYKGTEFKSDSFYGHSEKQILLKFAELLTKVQGKFVLCGKAIKRYDMPFIAKRMAINDIPIPYALNNGSKKPWEINVVDIGEMWGFGCNQETYTPLDIICVALGIPTSKSDINGAQVKGAYYDDDRLEDIKDYCERDVKVTALVEQRLSKLT